MESITDVSLIARHPGTIATGIGDETMLLHIDRGTYYGFDRVGSSIWSLLDPPRRVADILRTLRSSFDVDEDRCRDEVIAFLTTLHASDLISIEPSDP